MTQFRKKPVVIEAIQWDGTYAGAEKIFSEFGNKDFSINTTPGRQGLFIHTLEGVMQVSDNDFVIRGVAGELYPCKPDIFAKTYDPAPSPASPVSVGVAAADGVTMVGAFPSAVAMADDVLAAMLTRHRKTVDEWYGSGDNERSREATAAEADRGDLLAEVARLRALAATPAAGVAADTRLVEAVQHLRDCADKATGIKDYADCANELYSGIENALPLLEAMLAAPAAGVSGGGGGADEPFPTVVVEAAMAALRAARWASETDTPESLECEARTMYELFLAGYSLSAGTTTPVGGEGAAPTAEEMIGQWVPEYECQNSRHYVGIYPSKQEKDGWGVADVSYSGGYWQDINCARTYDIKYVLVREEPEWPTLPAAPTPTTEGSPSHA